MTPDLPRTVGPGDPTDTAIARGVQRPPTDAHHARPADEVGPAGATDSIPSSQAGSTPPSPAPVLRPESPPADRLDFDDRHATRATESDDLADRYIKLSKDRRKDDWHHFAMTMIAVVVCVAVFLAWFVVVSRLLPHLSSRQVTQVVAIAFVAGGGGVAVRAAGRELTNWFRSRGRGSKPL